MSDEDLEAAVLGGAQRYTRDEMAGAARMSLEQAGRLWRAMGFPDVGDSRAFTDADLSALLRVAALVERGLMDLDGIVEVARAMGQTTARLADWQVETFRRRAAPADGETWQEPALAEFADDLAELLPELEHLLSYVWRRQLAATVGRYLDHPAERGETAEALATVGFADLVSFTRLSRELDEGDLAALVQSFESQSADIVHGESGRLVKTLGDEVMFVANAPEHAARIALALHGTHARSERMPQLRIGLATGAVLNRMGDVFGTTVNRAARMTAIARPGTTVTDAVTSEALHGAAGYDKRFHMRALAPRPVRGLGLIRPYALVAI